MMKFDYISPRIKGDLPSICQEKFNRLLLEMGTRPDNRHVGSGMGGNPAQLTVLMDMRHILGGDLYDSIRFYPDNHEVIWGYRWFQDKSIRTVREELNNQFAIVAKANYAGRAVDLARVIASPNIRGFILNNKESFPEVWQVLLGNPQVESLSVLDQTLLAHAECQALAFDLDRGVQHNVVNVGQLLTKLCPEAVLLAVRSQIQIERIVKFNLDEHPVWSCVLNKINKSLDSK